MAEVFSTSSAPVSTEYQTITYVLKIEDYGDGKVKVTHLETDKPKPVAQIASTDRLNFSVPLAFGIAIEGYVDVGNKEISVWGTVFGKQFGNRYTAGFNGVTWSVDLWVAKGSIRVWVDGNILKVHYYLDPPIVSAVSGTIDVLTIPGL